MYIEIDKSENKNITKTDIFVFINIPEPIMCKHVSHVRIIPSTVPQKI